MVPKSFKLNNGLEIPSIGFGTWQAAPGQVEAAVETALKAGYRLIDCAYCYGNEAEVGAGLKKAFESGIKREEVFVTGKVWCTYMSRVEENLDMTLKDLGLQYLDLYLVHWPVAYNPNGNHEKFPMLPDNSARDVDWSQTHIDTWHSMERLLETGKVKSIGVCNYSKKYLDQLLPVAKVIPAVNQIENHPLLPQTEVVEECKKHGILVEAYSPLGSSGGPLLEDERVKKVAKKYGVGEGTVLLSWHVTNSRLPLAKSTTPSRIQTNLQLIDLDSSDLESISQIPNATGGIKRYVYPAHGVNFGFPDKDFGKDAEVEFEKKVKGGEGK